MSTVTRGASREPRSVIGRYALGEAFAAGGMATVHLGRVLGPGGFVRTVAIKRLHAHLADDPELVAMFLDEARLVARVVHPNVVSAIDVVSADGELALIMDYVRGESVARLSRDAAGAGERVPVEIAVAIMLGVLSGLHAAHEAKTEHGEPLGIVHRDVSPQNVLVGTDGVARVLDFGIAKAKFRLHSTKDGRLKGKLRYMSPEQLRRTGVDRRSDIYSASAMFWEVLAGRPLFKGDDPSAIVEQVLSAHIEPPRAARGTGPDPIDAIVLRGLAAAPEDRFPTALEMAEALERVASAATPREVGDWVLARARTALEARDAKVFELETQTGAAGLEGDGAARPRAPSHLETEIVREDRAPLGLLLDVPRAPSDDAASDGRAPAAEAPSRRREWGRAAISIGVATLAAVGLATCAIISSSSRVTSGSAPSASASAVTSAPEPASAQGDVPLAASSTGAGASAARRPAAAPSTRARPSRPSRPECDPPYFIDGEGHKQYHHQCL